MLLIRFISSNGAIKYMDLYFSSPPLLLAFSLFFFSRVIKVRYKCSFLRILKCLWRLGMCQTMHLCSLVIVKLMKFTEIEGTGNQALTRICFSSFTAMTIRFRKITIMIKLNIVSLSIRDSPLIFIMIFLY